MWKLSKSSEQRQRSVSLYPPAPTNLNFFAPSPWCAVFAKFPQVLNSSLNQPLIKQRRGSVSLAGGGGEGREGAACTGWVRKAGTRDLATTWMWAVLERNRRRAEGRNRRKWETLGSRIIKLWNQIVCFHLNTPHPHPPGVIFHPTRLREKL